MTTNQDILSFLRVDKEAREKEKQQEKEARCKERQEDMEKIADMIKTGVSEEVRSAIQPVEDRLARQEKETEGLGQQICTLMKEMEELKSESKNRQETPNPVSVEPTIALETYADVVGKGSQQEEDREYNRRVQEICNYGRKIIGFTPIEPRMLELQIQSFGAKSEEEAMRMEIHSYWKCEMKIKPSEIEKVEIVRIFHPSKEDWDTLYVEFKNEVDVDKIFGYTRVMVKKDHRVVRWFPTEMFERYRAVEKIAFDMREEKKKLGIKLQTRVKIGKYDIELKYRLPDSYWRDQPLPGDLPKIDPGARARPVMSASPPPGRPGRAPTSPTSSRPSRADMLATAIDGVLANQKALKAAEVEMSKKENEKKRQFSGSHEDESMKRPKGDELGGEMDLVLER